MKKLTLFFIAAAFSITVFAQEDVTKFLGISIDGFKSEMINKLKSKGFVEHTYSPDILVGEFIIVGSIPNTYLETDVFDSPIKIPK
jgi:hypothetical protein